MSHDVNKWSQTADTLLIFIISVGCSIVIYSPGFSSYSLCNSKQQPRTEMRIVIEWLVGSFKTMILPPPPPKDEQKLFLMQ